MLVFILVTPLGIKFESLLGDKKLLDFNCLFALIFLLNSMVCASVLVESRSTTGFLLTYVGTK